MSKKMYCVFWVPFDPEIMCDKETLDKEWGGSWLKCLRWLVKEEGIGIFEAEFKLVEVK